MLLPEAGLDAQHLADTLRGLLSDRSRQVEMATRARASAVPDAAGRVADVCQEFLAP